MKKYHVHTGANTCEKRSTTWAIKRSKPLSRKKGLKRTPLKRVSAKRKDQNKEYAKLRKKFLEEHPWCARMAYQFPHAKAAWVEATDIHHAKGRSGSFFLDTRFWIPVSRNAHMEIERYPKWAMAHGFSFMKGLGWRMDIEAKICRAHQRRVKV